VVWWWVQIGMTVSRYARGAPTVAEGAAARLLSSAQPRRAERPTLLNSEQTRGDGPA